MGSISICEIFHISICFALVSRQCPELSSNATHSTRNTSRIRLSIQSNLFNLGSLSVYPATCGREKDRQNSNFIYHYNMVLHTEFNIVTGTVASDLIRHITRVPRASCVCFALTRLGLHCQH